MQRKAVAERGGGPKRAQGGKRARDFARQRLGRLPVDLADAVDRRMGVNVFGGLTRLDESPIEVIEGLERDGAKDGELQRAGRAFDIGAGAAEARRRVSEERENRARRELDRGVKD